MIYPPPRILNNTSRYDTYMAFAVPVSYHNQPPSPDNSCGMSSLSNVYDTGLSMDPNQYPQHGLQSYVHTHYINPDFTHTQFQTQRSSGSSHAHISSFEDPQTYAGIPPNHPLRYFSMPSNPPRLPMSSSVDDFSNSSEDEVHYGLSLSPEGFLRDEAQLHRHSDRKPRLWPTDAQTEDYLRKTLAIPASLPLNLWSLPDVVPSKPLPKIAVLIKLAIWGSPGHKLTLRQIYKAIEERYPFLQEADDKPWQRSIRHSLSLRAIFVRMDRPDNHPGKGYYWRLDVNKGEQYTRDSKRAGLDNEAHSDTGSEDHRQISPASVHSDYHIDRYKLEEASIDLYPPPNTSQVHSSARLPHLDSELYSVYSSHGTYDPSMGVPTLHRSSDVHPMGGPSTAPYHRNTIPGSSRAMGNHVPSGMTASPVLMGEQWPHRRNTTENMSSRVSYQPAPAQNVPMGGISHTHTMRSARRPCSD